MSSTEAPATATSYTPFVTDLMRLARAPFAPTAVFEEQGEKPTFWMPFAVVSAISIVIGILMAPYQQRMQQLMAQQAGQPVRGSGGLLGTIVGAPLQVLIGAAIGASLLYALVSLTGGTASYKKMLSIVIFAWPVFLVQQALGVLVLRMRGVDSIASPMDIMVSFGLDNLLPADMQLGYFLQFFLAFLSPFLLWSIGVKAAGVMVYAKSGKGGAWTAATIYSVTVIVLTAAFIGFGMKMAMSAGAR